MSNPTPTWAASAHLQADITNDMIIMRHSRARI